MNTDKIELDTENNPNLPEQLKAAMGKEIKCSNGCSLYLIDEEGLFWGVSPYGLDWACNSDDRWLESVLNWLSFWNEPRTETGFFCDD